MRGEAGVRRRTGGGACGEVLGARRAIGTPPAGCAITYKRRGVRMDYTVPLRKEIRRIDAKASGSKARRRRRGRGA